MILYFARHGESEANVTRTFSNRDLPHHLTDQGIEHARQLALRLESFGIDELWCSPVPRAVETATIVGEALGLPYQTTEGLREFNVGRFEGTGSEEGWQEYAGVVRAWREGDHERRVGGGESLPEIVARLKGFLDMLLNDEPDDRRVGLIAHGGLYFTALPHIFANISPEFAFANTRGYGLVIVGEARDGELACVDWDGRTMEQDPGH